jgi:hypothetical protein
VGINVEMIDPGRVEGGRSTDQTVDFVSLAQQEFGEIRTVLAGDPKY